jgi:hypothetical protein
MNHTDEQPGTPAPEQAPLWERVQKWARRHKPVVALAAGLLLMAVASPAVSLALVWMDRDEAKRRSGAPEMQKLGPKSAQAKEPVRGTKITARQRASEMYQMYDFEVANGANPYANPYGLGPNQSITTPPASQIYSGTALNALLADLQQLQAKRLLTTPQATRRFADEEEVLKHIDITTTHSTGEPGHLRNVGLPKDLGNLRWPLAFCTEPFKKDVDADIEVINDNLDEAVHDAANGRNDASVIKVLSDARDRLADKLKDNIRDLPQGQYQEAKRFLNSLGQAVNALKQADAGSYFNGAYNLKAKSVAELVEAMRKRGLCFAPAAPGDEQAYVQFYHILAGVAAGVEDKK